MKECVTHHFACDCREAQFKALQAKCDDYEKALDEAVDWLCSHTDAAADLKKIGDGRAWCSQCHNYIRCEEDVTLQGRIREVLAKHKVGG